MTFKELGIAEPILKALASEGYENPTPIQEKSIPILLKGKEQPSVFPFYITYIRTIAA